MKNKNSQPLMTFTYEGEKVGELLWKGKELKFEGNSYKTARVIKQVEELYKTTEESLRRLESLIP